jgi:hypothetical protein
MAGSLTKVMDGYVLTSILNTSDQEVEIQEPLVELDETEPIRNLTSETEEKQKDREKRILGQLRLDHLNDEENKLLMGTCQDYQDIFYLPGDSLSSTVATQHSIRVQQVTEPVNTRQYRLPEAQKVEVERQVEKLLKEGIIEESNSLWNSPILVMAKKMDASGKQKFRLVADYRKLNEKTVGDAYPLPDITKISDKLG